MTIEFEYKKLLEPSSTIQGFGELLLEAISARKPIFLELGPNRVCIGVDHDALNKADVQMVGSWASELLTGSDCSVGELILLPYVFLIERISLMPKAIYHLGRADRSVCDFFMRNYFYAACRNSSIEVRSSGRPRSDSAVRAALSLCRGYTWIVRVVMPEDIFEDRNALELILAGAHTSLFQFKNSVLQSGLLGMQKRAQSCQPAPPMAVPTERFLQVRTKVLAAMGVA